MIDAGMLSLPWMEPSLSKLILGYIRKPAEWAIGSGACSVTVSAPLKSSCSEFFFLALAFLNGELYITYRLKYVLFSYVVFGL